jgi:peroxiredoxin family protein
MDETISIVLFSGTDDKLQSAAVLTAGAAALGKPVRILLQYWALRAFTLERMGKSNGYCPEAGESGRAAFEAAAAGGGLGSWADTLRASKELGDVDIQACSQSMDVLKIAPSDLDPMVGGVQGVASFYLNAGEGQIVFI